MIRSDVQVIVDALRGFNQYRYGDNYQPLVDEIASVIELEYEDELEKQKKLAILCLPTDAAPQLKSVPIRVGAKLYGYCGFTDLGQDKTVEALGIDWVVARDTNGDVQFYRGNPEYLTRYTDPSLSEEGTNDD